MAIEQAFCKSWETWDQFDTCDLQFGNIEGALPSGLESFLDQDEIASYYETGKL